MKVAFLIDKFPSLSETFVINQAFGLLERGHTVDIYAHRTDGLDRNHAVVEQYGLRDRTTYTQMPVHPLRRWLKGLTLFLRHFPQAPQRILRSLNGFKYGRSASSLRLFYRTVSLLNAPAYDIIHGQFGMYGLEATYLREIGAIQGKVVSTFRGGDISWYVQLHGPQVYQPLFAKGDFFLANCEFFRQRAIQLGCDPLNIKVLRSGLDYAKFPYRIRQPEPNGTIRVVTTGRLVEKKGIEYGIKAIAQVLRTYPHLEYHIVGDGYLMKPLQQLIQDLGVTDHVKLLGWKTHQELIEILDRAHLFMAPCVTAKDGNQDAPVNTLKEAMAMGLPVIATEHGGIPELVEDEVSGFLVPERNVDAIAQKLNVLIAHPDYWKRMGQSGRLCVETTYSLTELNDQLVQVYQHILNSDQMQTVLSPSPSSEQLPNKLIGKPV
jgi:colanic acid/amylovoran biosynthesis glycosyltransferase